jgi:hypothetical protein
MAVNTYITHNPIIFVLTYMCAHAEQQSGSAASERAVGRRGTKRQQQNIHHELIANPSLLQLELLASRSKRQNIK